MAAVTRDGEIAVAMGWGDVDLAVAAGRTSLLDKRVTNPDPLPFRIALPEDHERILDLMRVYYVEDGYPFIEPIARHALTSLLTSPEVGRVWVAEAGGAIVAYAVLTFGFSLEYGGRDAFVDELFVLRDYRGRGLGGAALLLMQRACVEAGVRALHLEVEREKSSALGLYRREGFLDHDRRLMTKVLAPSTPPGAVAGSARGEP